MVQGGMCLYVVPFRSLAWLHNNAVLWTQHTGGQLAQRICLHWLIWQCMVKTNFLMISTWRPLFRGYYSSKKEWEPYGSTHLLLQASTSRSCWLSCLNWIQVSEKKHNALRSWEMLEKFRFQFMTFTKVKGNMFSVFFFQLLAVVEHIEIRCVITGVSWIRFQILIGLVFTNQYLLIW